MAKWPATSVVVVKMPWKVLAATRKTVTVAPGMAGGIPPLVPRSRMAPVMVPPGGMAMSMSATVVPAETLTTVAVVKSMAAGWSVCTYPGFRARIR
jgi:hypothetical protein